MFHPSRGGVRGGKDQFKWDNVKEDKFRENYLGHSVMAPVGRWQKGKDLTWYAKDKKSGSALVDEELRAKELQRVKEDEEAAMMEMLGLPRPKRMRQEHRAGLGKTEVEGLLKKGSLEGQQREPTDGDRNTGLGFRSRVTERSVETMTERGEKPKDEKGRAGVDRKGSTGERGEEEEAVISNVEGSRAERRREALGQERREELVRNEGKGEEEEDSADSEESGSETSSSSEKDEEGRQGGEGESVGARGKGEGQVGETRSQKKARRRREKRQERRKKLREEELSGSKNVSEKRLRRRRRELRLERKKERREQKKKRLEEPSRSGKEDRSGGDKGRLAGAGTFEDMFKSGRLMADRDSFVKERRTAWREQGKMQRQEGTSSRHMRDA